uniref:Uncharacterized protein n=1 Tax=Arundo donax TaxID=35708 RepID=A0A0A8ZE76_ARUDO
MVYNTYSWSGKLDAIYY